MESKYNMTIEENLELAKRLIIDSIYKEARLEGINVTFPETQQIYEGFPVNDLTIENTTKIVNLKRAWEFVLQTIVYPFDIRYMRHLNGIIENSLIRNAGVLRVIGVKISGTDWVPQIPTQEAVEQELERVRKIINPAERAIELMLTVMRGQYFEDGNKRTAQLMANQELIRHGCGIVSIPVEKNKEFSALLISFYESNDSRTIKEFVYDECLYGEVRTSTISEAEKEKQRKEDLETIMNYCARKN